MTEKFILTGLFFFGVLLFGTMNRNGGRHDLRTPLDAAVPFIPAFSIPYMLLFPYIAYAGFVLFNTLLSTEYYGALAISMLTAAVVWYVFPAKMPRPVVSKSKFPESIVYHIYEADTNGNSIPSSHVFTSLVTSYYLALLFPSFFFLIWIAGITIALSTIIIKQHFVADVVVGIFWAYASITLAHIFFA